MAKWRTGSIITHNTISSQRNSKTSVSTPTAISPNRLLCDVSTDRVRLSSHYALRNYPRFSVKTELTYDSVCSEIIQDLRQMTGNFQHENADTEDDVTMGIHLPLRLSFCSFITQIYNTFTNIRNAIIYIFNSQIVLFVVKNTMPFFDHCFNGHWHFPVHTFSKPFFDCFNVGRY